MDRFEGNLELVSRDRIMGWAFVRARPDEPVQVEISDGVNPPATITADVPRRDLQAVGKGNGVHAFLFQPAGRFAAGKTYTIHAKVVGAAAELNHSPQELVVSGDGGGTIAPTTDTSR